MATGKYAKFKGFKWTVGDEDVPALALVVDDASKLLHICEPDDADTDWALAAATHPTVCLHSATTPATKYIKMYHDATNAYLDAVGATTLQLLVAGTEIGRFSTTQTINKNTTLFKTTQTALTDTATVTAANMLTQVLDGTQTAAATYTLSTAALLVAAIPGAAVGSSFMFFINNKSAGANTITVAAGVGGTADGTLTVAQHVIRSFLVIITNVTAASEAYSVYGIAA